MPLKTLPDGKQIVILSYSAFSVYQQCPQRYYREKILREKTGEDDLSFNIPGTISHKATEVYLKSGDERIFESSVLNAAVEKHSHDPQVDLVKAYGSIDKAAEFTRLCAQNLQRFLVSRNIRSKQFLSEEWFGNWDEPLMLSENLGTQGAPDLIEINPNGSAILYDYKATWSTKNLNKDQLILYCIASELKFNVKISMSAFYLLPANKHEYFNFTEQDKLNLKNRMQDAANNILMLGPDLPYTPNEKCNRCPYASSCKEKDKFIPKKFEPPKGDFGGFGTIDL